MATADAIDNVGQTLVTLLQAAAIPGVANADILVATPDDFTGLASRAAPFPPTITILLYRVAIATPMRNAPRRALPDGTTSRPLLPLELQYLVTPWATSTAFEHRIIGRVVQCFYDRPELGIAELQGAGWEPGDSVQLVFDSLPLQDHLRLWETVDAPYRLSLAYTARVVGIEPTVRVGTAPVVEAIFGAPLP